MIKRFYAACTAIILAAGCSGDSDGNIKTNRKADTLTKNLSSPWNITSSEKEWLISERAGSIIQIKKDNNKKTSFSPSLAKSLHVSGEGGFLGFELHPDYPAVAKGYAYYTYLDGSKPFNTIAELTLKQNSWRETKTLIDQIPAGVIHNGGRIKFGPDGMLYATVGDAGIPENAQSKTSLAGKILRISPEGAIPEDNPFAESPVYSLGHRNPQGLAWAADGTMYAAEHGQNHFDEINLIQSGGNYGWPLYEGDEKIEGYIPPFVHSGKETWAPSGMLEFDGHLYVACLRGEKIIKINVNKQEVTAFFTGKGRIRDILKEKKMLLAITNNTDGRGVPKKGDDRMLKIEVR